VSESPDKGLEELFEFFGPRERRSCGSGRALGGAFASVPKTKTFSKPFVPQRDQDKNPF
jgi:hypothetical protein